MAILRNGLTKTTIKKVENLVEASNAKYMDMVVGGYGKSLTDDKNKSVGEITISSNNYSAIRLLPSELSEGENVFKPFKTMAQKALTLVLGDMEGFGKGTGKYYGLYIEAIKADGVELDLVTISSEQEKAIIAEILACDLDNEDNLRKIFEDINKAFRMYQELTIDAAKKLYQIAVTFYMNTIKANSVIHMDHDFVNFNQFKEETEEKNFSIFRKDARVAPRGAMVGQPHEFQDKNGKVNRIAFMDSIAEVQDAAAETVEEFINGKGFEGYKESKLSDTTINSFGIGSDHSSFAKDLYHLLRLPYSKIVAWTIAESNKVKKSLADHKISNYACAKRLDEIEELRLQMIEDLNLIARFVTKDMDMVDAGRYMFMCSNIKNEGAGNFSIDSESTNQMFLAIAPELFTAYSIAEHADIKVCGYPVMGDKSLVNEGDELEFVNGEVEGMNIFVNSDFTGKLTIQTIDGTLSAVKPIEIPRVEVEAPENIAVSLIQSSIIDINKFMYTGEIVWTKSFATLSEQKILERATSFTLRPIFRVKNNKGKTVTLKDVLVATLPRLDDPSVVMDVPVATYLCYSGKFERLIAGLTCSKLNRVKIDRNTMRVELPYGTFVDTELNHAAVEDMMKEFTDVNNDIYSSSIVVDNKAVHEDPLAPTKIGTEEYHMSIDTEMLGYIDSTIESIDEQASMAADFDWSEFLL